jgi:hypothetical protein
VLKIRELGVDDYAAFMAERKRQTLPRRHRGKGQAEQVGHPERTANIGGNRILSASRSGPRRSAARKADTISIRAFRYSADVDQRAMRVECSRRVAWHG